MSAPSAVDLTSPDFDPLLALYSEEVQLPCPDVLPYDNLAQYESSAKNDSETAGNRKAVTVEEALHARKSRWSAREGRPAQEDERKRDPNTFYTFVATQKKKKFNVLTRMRDEYYKGPLTLLTKCVKERRRVKVWTRAAQHVRGFCTGFVVVFDKHFNMALVDVDESYLPVNVEQETSSYKRRKKRTKKKALQRIAKDSNECEPQETDGDNKRSIPEMGGVVELLSWRGDHDVSSERLVHGEKVTGHSSAKEKVSSSESSSGTPIKGNIDESCDVEALTEKLKHLQEELAHLPDNESSVSADVRGDVQATTVEPGSSLMDKGEKEKTLVNLNVQHRKSRTAVQYLQRHVGQLMIRGDNVVMVALVDQ